MAKKETKVEASLNNSDAVKSLIIKHAHSLFEREPTSGFVIPNLNKLVEKINNLFK